MEYDDITDVQITNLQGEPLGRIADLTLDLTNGRIVEVLVVSGQNRLGFGGKTIAVPPPALVADAHNKVYQINVSVEKYKAAPAFSLSDWAESTQPGTIAAAYHYFGQVPNFLAAGEAPGRTAASGRPVTSLGIVERMTNLLNMPVDNVNGEQFGTLESLTLDVPTGRILNAFIRTPAASNMEAFGGSSTVVPPMMLSFTPARRGLVLDVSQVVYSKEPHVIFKLGGDGQAISTRQQDATGPPTTAALAQGAGFRDTNLTAQIHQAIQDGNFEPETKIEVGTLEGRVTLRGSVPDQAAKDRIGAIAIALVRLDNVDNQIVVTAGSKAPP
jgi:sporulation protein YlmC with PRC-barrel domain